MASEHYLKQELYDRLRHDSSIFEFLQSGSLDGIWYWDLEAPENEWMSPHFWLTLGYEPEQMAHRADAWQDIINPEDLEVATLNFTLHCENPTHPYDQIVRYRHADGSTVWIRCRGMAIRDAQDQPIRMLGAHTDITALMQSEARLEQTYAQSNWQPWLLEINDKSPLKVVIIDDDEVDADILCRLLQSAGLPTDIIILTASSEVETYFANHTDTQLVFVDYHVGPELGTDIIAQHLPSMPLVHFVLLTGRNDESLVLDGMRVGAKDFLRKSNLEAADIQRILEQTQTFWLQQNKLHLQSDAIARQAMILENTSDFVGVARPDQQLLYLNSAARNILGIPRNEDIKGKSFLDAHTPSSQQVIESEILPLIESGETWRGELELSIDSESVLPVSVAAFAIWDALGGLSSIAMIMRDISEEKSREKSLEYSANHDALTGLANRNMLLKQLSHVMAKAQRDKQLVAVLYIDLDHFKGINDTLGHDAGDALLKKVSTRMLSTVRGIEMVSRIGGDEFVIVMNGLDDAHYAFRLAERILQLMKTPMHIEGHDIFMTPSIGIATYPDSGTSPEDLLKNADLAMYHAKESGRNGIRFFSDDLQQLATQYEDTRHSLQSAMQQGEMFMVYQSIVDRERKVTGWEALVRWQKTDGTVILPDQFIAIAEKTSQIVELGRWIIKRCLADFAAFRMRIQTKLAPTISINISTFQLRDSELETILVSEAKQNQISHDHIILEITESALVSERQGYIEVLQKLADLGFKLAVDDFGTGYASYRHLKELPFSILKIDRCFITGVDKSKETAALATSLLDLARGLSMTVVAEGVEREGEATFLIEHQCSRMQGYLFHYPCQLNDLVS